MDQPQSQWTIDTLRVALETKIDAMDRLYSERSVSQNTALAKAEAATEKRFESVNEFRAQMGDQQRTMMPRLEAEMAIKALSERLSIAESAIMDRRSEGVGVKSGWTLAVAAVALIGMLWAMFGGGK